MSFHKFVTKSWSPRASAVGINSYPSVLLSEYHWLQLADALMLDLMYCIIYNCILMLLFIRVLHFHYQSWLDFSTHISNWPYLFKAFCRPTFSRSMTIAHPHPLSHTSLIVYLGNFHKWQCLLQTSNSNRPLPRSNMFSYSQPAIPTWTLSPPWFCWIFTF